jgi:signal peptidase I
MLDLVAVLLVIGVVSLALAGLIATRLGGGVVIVAGPSMEPALGVGSLAFLTHVGAGPRVGEVVTLRMEGGQLLTHRVTRLASVDAEPYLETKGDANPTPDPVLSPASALVGEVAFAIPDAGYLESALARPLGILSILGILAGLWLAAGVLREVGRSP